MKVDSSVYTREQVAANLRKAVASTPVSFDFLLKQAEIESGLNPYAKASTSSATGPFQFVNGTWLRMVEKYGDHVGLSEQAAALRENKLDGEAKAELLALRTDVGISGKMAAHFALENAQALASSGLNNIGPTELYLAHFLGAGGAKDFLTGMRANPNGPAAEALPAAARSNTNVFYNNGSPRSFTEIYTRFAQKFSGVSAPLADGMARSASIPADVAQVGQGFNDVAQQVLAETRKAHMKAANAQLENVQQSSANAEEMTAQMAELSEAALAHYLSSFSKGFEDPSKAPIEAAQSDLRDASQAASSEAGMNMQDQAFIAASGVALGTKIVMDSAGAKPRASEQAAAATKNNVASMAPAVRQAVEWVSLFSDARNAEAANNGRV